MPHDKNGNLLAAGDVVKGVGYNLKDDAGELREIVGTIIAVTQASACNVTLLVTDMRDLPADYQAGEKHPMVPVDAHPLLDARRYAVLVTEHGQADHFEKIL